MGVQSSVDFRLVPRSFLYKGSFGSFFSSLAPAGPPLVSWDIISVRNVFCASSQVFNLIEYFNYEHTVSIDVVCRNIRYFKASIQIKLGLCSVHCGSGNCYSH